MGCRGLQRKLNRFLYYRRLPKSQRRSMVGQLRAKSDDRRGRKQLYRQLRTLGKESYKLHYWKLFLMILTVIQIAGLLACYAAFAIPAYTALLTRNDELFELATEIDTALIPVQHALAFGGALDQVKLVVFLLGLVLFRIRLRDFGRNLVVELFHVPVQLFILVGTVGIHSAWFEML